MAKFYGMVEGGRSAATRTGTKNSGFLASAQSYDGSVSTILSYDDYDNLKINLEISDGSSVRGTTYFSGTLNELKAQLRK